MEIKLNLRRFVFLAGAARPRFLTASAAPVLVGSAAGFYSAGSFDAGLFFLAMPAIVLLHTGANMANDYFDHISGNDRANKNPTPFSGGSRYIQNNILSPKTTLMAALTALSFASMLGITIVLLTKSAFILVLGVAGLLGGFFYTAPPVKLSYRTAGEVTIALLFGLLAVYGAYYLQTKSVDFIPLMPAVIISIHIFLVILINEFPDIAADAAADKKTVVVRFGIDASIWIYRAVLIGAFVITLVAMFVYRRMFWAGLFYLMTAPIAVMILIEVNKKNLTAPSRCRANRLTILMHLLSALALSAGFLLTGLQNSGLVPEF